jgi:HPt (histidine-containing phosphotransfer) domain-containing protein
VDPEFDAAVLASLREQMGEEYPELLGIFDAESARHLEELRVGIETGAWENARRGAHSLKSSAALFGLVRLSGAMREIERLPDATPPAEWRERLAEAQKLRSAGIAWIRSPGQNPAHPK